jgi:eukaryotic-like serine/threonine-protein kinase
MSALSPEQWQEISPYLDHALSLSEEERAEWLRDFRTQRADLAGLLEKLLEEHRALAQEQFLEQGPLRPASDRSLTGEVLGPYKLISRIGEGGMGNVWLAERVDGRFERQVAVKFLHFAVASQGAAQRFKREGKILGQLAHAHIAELIDAGVTGEGAPYLVLEHVKGKQIDEYCDERKLGVDERIELFLDVLSAVAHAHANLVVHRDIKPSNVFVTDEGQVKLLDFGIAKLLADEGNPAAATQLTLEGGALTPWFAAPEQVSGSAITTATDVYSLGVLLYLLLTGRHPAGRGPHSAADLVKAITETEPARPSEAVDAGDEELAKKRSASPEKLRRSFRGDLDTIAGKALKKNPTERYPSVGAFAEDLQRFLRHQPISARPDTIGYRAAKFVRRNRTAVTLTALALAAVMAGLAGTLIQARAARKQRDFARRQLARAERVNELNQFLLSDASASGERFTVTELLDRAREIVERENYSNDPENHVELLISLGRQYTQDSRDPKALPLLQKAYQMSRGLADPSIRARASCALADFVINPKDNSRAASLIQEGMRELPGSPEFALDRVFCLLMADDVDSMGSLVQPLADDQAAERILDSSALGSSYLRLNVLTNIGVDSMQTDLAQAIAADTQATVLEEELGYGHTATAADTFASLGLALMKAGRPYEAEQAYRRSNEIRPSKLWAYPMQAYAEALRELGRLDEAADYAKRAYAKVLTEDKNYGVEVFCLTILVRVYRDQRDFSRAEATLSQLEKLAQSIWPPGDFFFPIITSERSLLSQAEGNLSAALASADQAVASEEAYIRLHPGVTDRLPQFLYCRAAIEVAVGQPEKAISDAQRAIDLLQRLLGADALSAYIGRAYFQLGRALDAEGKKDEARAAFRTAAEHLEKTLGTDHAESRAARQLAGLNP